MPDWHKLVFWKKPSDRGPGPEAQQGETSTEEKIAKLKQEADAWKKAGGGLRTPGYPKAVVEEIRAMLASGGWKCGDYLEVLGADGQPPSRRAVGGSVAAGAICAPRNARPTTERSGNFRGTALQGRSRGQARRRAAPARRPDRDGRYGADVRGAVVEKVHKDSDRSPGVRQSPVERLKRRCLRSGGT